MSLHKALVFLKVDLIEGTQGIKRILKPLSQHSKIVASSSIYKKFLTPAQDDLNAELWTVVKLETELYLYEFSDMLFNLQGQINQRQIVEGRRGRFTTSLLTFEDEVNMAPNLTLPSPALHSEPLILRCAAEVWGEYVHPVVHTSLAELAKQIVRIHNVEFHSQGRELAQ